MTFQDGEIVNGHRFDAATNAWVPVAPPLKRPAPGRPLGPCVHCGSATGVRWERRAVDWLGGLAVVLGVAVSVLTGNVVGDAFGVAGAALLGGLVGLAVLTPIVATRRYRCSECGKEQRRPGKPSLSPIAAIVLTLAAVAGTSALLILADVRAHTYPEPDHAAFMSSCQKGSTATTAYCQCAFDAIQRTYTLREYRALDASLAKGGPLPEHAKAVIAACRPTA